MTKSIIIILSSVSPLLGEVLIVGSDIITVTAKMKKAEYKENALQMASRLEDHELKFWQVDEGTLIVQYSAVTNKISNVTYWFSDERGRGVRKEFTFKVESFDIDSGKLLINTK